MVLKDPQSKGGKGIIRALTLRHPLTNFEIQMYCRNEPNLIEFVLDIIYE